MTKEEFRKEILDAVENRPEYIRYGQAVFNYIDMHYGVARFLQFHTKLDCFYNDGLVDEFIDSAYKLLVDDKK